MPPDVFEHSRDLFKQSQALCDQQPFHELIGEAKEICRAAIEFPPEAAAYGVIDPRDHEGILAWLRECLEKTGREGEPFWTVFIEDGPTLCFTGNGPHGEALARFFAAAVRGLPGLLIILEEIEAAFRQATQEKEAQSGDL